HRLGDLLRALHGPDALPYVSKAGHGRSGGPLTARWPRNQPPCTREACLRRMSRTVALGFAGLLAAALVPTVYIDLSTRRHLVAPEAAPAVPWGIVFGAGLAPGGEPSPILAER